MAPQIKLLLQKNIRMSIEIVSIYDTFFDSGGDVDDVDIMKPDKKVEFVPNSTLIIFDNEDDFQLGVILPGPMTIKNLTEMILAVFESRLIKSSESTEHIYRMISGFFSQEDRLRLVIQYELGNMTIGDVVSYGFGEEETFFGGIVLRDDGKYQLYMAR